MVASGHSTALTPEVDGPASTPNNALSAQEARKSAETVYTPPFYYVAADVPTITPDPDRIKTPLSYNDAVDLALVAYFDHDDAGRILSASDMNAIPVIARATVYRMARTLMALDIASREDVWEDRGGPELLAAAKGMHAAEKREYGELLPCGKGMFCFICAAIEKATR